VCGHGGTISERRSIGKLAARDRGEALRIGICARRPASIEQRLHKTRTRELRTMCATDASARLAWRGARGPRGEGAPRFATNLRRLPLAAHRVRSTERRLLFNGIHERRRAPGSNTPRVDDREVL
jgi:hypothetical protein